MSPSALIHTYFLDYLNVSLVESESIKVIVWINFDGSNGYKANISPAKLKLADTGLELSLAITIIEFKCLFSVLCWFGIFVKTI